MFGRKKLMELEANRTLADDVRAAAKKQDYQFVRPENPQNEDRIQIRLAVEHLNDMLEDGGTESRRRAALFIDTLSEQGYLE